MLSPLHQWVKNLKVSVIQVNHFIHDIKWNFVERYFPYTVFWFVEHGSFSITVNGHEELVDTINSSYFLHLPHGSYIKARAISAPIIYYSVRFHGHIQSNKPLNLTSSPQYASSEIIWSEKIKIPTVISRQANDLKPYFESLFYDFHSNSFNKYIKIQIIILTLLNKAFESHTHLNENISQTNSQKDKRLQVIYNFLLNHPNEFPSNKDLCRLLLVSESYMLTLFKKILGVSPGRYVHLVKIELAKEALIHSEERIVDISEKLGYESANYFSRIFKRYVRSTPSEFRNDNKMF